MDESARNNRQPTSFHFFVALRIMEKGFGTPWVDSIQELCPFVRFGVVGAAAHWLFVAGTVKGMKLGFDGRSSEIHVAFAMEEGTTVEQMCKDHCALQLRCARGHAS